MKVSIIIPVFNGSNFLRQAIESALSQTYPETEIIVVNDGSDDGGRTAAIARSFGRRLIYIEQENGGVAAAMNAGLSRMSGDVFTWLSHDDLHLPGKVSSQVEHFDRLGRPSAALFSNFFLINEHGEVWHESDLPYGAYIDAPMLPLLHAHINGCTLFIPRGILEEFGPFDEGLRYTQDYALWSRILSRYEFFFQPETLVKYRVHPGQDTNKPSALAESESLWVQITEARSEIERVNLFGSTRRYYRAMAEFLERTPYQRAAATIKARLPCVVQETLVSVILPCGDNVDDLVATARSVLDQGHTCLELLLVDDDQTREPPLVSSVLMQDTRVRRIATSAEGARRALERAVEVALGSYLAFVEAGDIFAPAKVETQLAGLQTSGRLISCTLTSFDGVVEPPPGAADGQAKPDMSTVMMHRILVAAGFFRGQNAKSAEVWQTILLHHPALYIDEPLTLKRRRSTPVGMKVEP